jgi:hypothetical protein
MILQNFDLHHKIIQHTLTANNYMFRPLTSYHQVVHPMKSGVGAVQSSNPPFHWMYNLVMVC